MVFRLRRADGTPDPFSSRARWCGRTAACAAWARTISLFSQLPTGAARTRAPSYPAGWTLEVPAEKLRLEIRPHLADQEMTSPIPTGKARWG